MMCTHFIRVFRFVLNYRAAEYMAQHGRLPLLRDPSRLAVKAQGRSVDEIGGPKNRPTL